MAKNTSSMSDALGGIGRLTELRQRLLFVLGALLVYRIGTFIPVPGVNPEALALLFDQNQGSILDMFNMFSGGALERASLFALGIMPRETMVATSLRAAAERAIAVGRYL